MKLTLLQKGRLREAVLEFLVERRMRAPWRISGIVRLLRERQALDFDFDEYDVEEALVVLEQFGYVSQTPTGLDYGTGWSVTADGINYYERHHDVP